MPGVAVTASAPDVLTTHPAAVSDAEVWLPSGARAFRAVCREGHLVGFRDFARDAILVRSGQVTTIHAELVLSTVTENVTVLGQTTPLVDVTRAVSGTDITLRLTESLPTGRSARATCNWCRASAETARFRPATRRRVPG